jgi:hypothetical protein
MNRFEKKVAVTPPSISSARVVTGRPIMVNGGS